MSLFKSVVLDANKKPIIVLWIGAGQYSDVQGKTVNSTVWKSAALVTGVKMQGFMDGQVLRLFDRSGVFTLIGFNQNLKKGGQFRVQTTAATYGCEVYEEPSNAAPMVLNGQITAPTQPQTWTPPPGTGNQADFLQRQMEDYMNGEALKLPGN